MADDLAFAECSARLVGAAIVASLLASVVVAGPSLARYQADGYDIPTHYVGDAKNMWWGVNLTGEQCRNLVEEYIEVSEPRHFPTSGAAFAL
jgi:hypothetical protein